MTDSQTLNVRKRRFDPSQNPSNGSFTLSLYVWLKTL
jgi:hypothetical protein